MQANRRGSDDLRVVERAIILQLLRDDHHERWSLKQLERELEDTTPEAMSDAIASLNASGVIYRLDEFIGASRCARHLDSLELIGV
jgi:hypothetical protein